MIDDEIIQVLKNKFIHQENLIQQLQREIIQI